MLITIQCNLCKRPVRLQMIIVDGKFAYLMFIENLYSETTL
jgi:hypothetical protein